MTEISGAGDLSDRAAVHDLVVDFYREVVFDVRLEPLFGEVAEVDWSHHIPNLIDYWCRILFLAPGYRGDVMAAHRHLHGLRSITSEDCDRWFGLWVSCVDGRWAGPHAADAKAHAARLMAGMAKHLFGFTWTVPVAGARRGLTLPAG